MKSLADAVVHAMAFLELSDDATVSEDAAVSMLEQLSAILQKASKDELAAIEDALAKAKRGTKGKVREFYDKFFPNCGLHSEIGQKIPTKSKPRKQTPAAERSLWKQLADDGDGNVAVVKALIENDPRLIHATDKQGYSPLHYAAFNGHNEVVALLLGCKAVTDARNDHGETPLHVSVLNGHKEITAMLLEAGAEVNAKNDAGETPLSATRSADPAFSQQVARMLRKYGGTYWRKRRQFPPIG